MIVYDIDGCRFYKHRLFGWCVDYGSYTGQHALPIKDLEKNELEVLERLAISFPSYVPDELKFQILELAKKSKGSIVVGQQPVTDDKLVKDRNRDRVTLTTEIDENFQCRGKDLFADLGYVTVIKLADNHEKRWNIVPRDRHLADEAFSTFSEVVERILRRWW
jgi:hypothetical protein